MLGDVHTHLGSPYQSGTDCENPMVGVAGHIAIIVPALAQRLVKPDELGIYEYQGSHRWQAYTGQEAAKFFYIGRWG